MEKYPDASGSARGGALPAEAGARRKDTCAETTPLAPERQRKAPPTPRMVRVTFGRASLRVLATSRLFYVAAAAAPPPGRLHFQRAASSAAVSWRRNISPQACAADAVLTGELDILGRPVQKVNAPQAAGGEGEQRVEPGNSEPVVKVYSVHSGVSPTLPWTSKPQEESSGSGFTIDHDGSLCILTNAHVVADATYVEVRKAGDARKYVATRKKVSHECDLATLTVEVMILPTPRAASRSLAQPNLAPMLRTL